MHKYVGIKHSSKAMAQALVLGRLLSRKTPDKPISILSLMNTLLINSSPKVKHSAQTGSVKQEPFPLFYHWAFP